jgi:hypothetical protein
MGELLATFLQRLDARGGFRSGGLVGVRINLLPVRLGVQKIAKLTISGLASFDTLPTTTPNARLLSSNGCVTTLLKPHSTSHHCIIHRDGSD